MKGRTLTIIVLIALIILAPLVFRPKDAVAPVKNADNQMKESFQFGGNPDDLISFSIKHGQEVSGKVKVAGEIKGGWFFEGNILINLLDSDKKMMRPGHATATTDWMTSGPVSFAGDIDFTGMYRGKAYVQIMADDPSDHAAGPDAQSKNILIPVVIK